MAEMKWESIESAPQDGSEIILGGHGWVSAGFWNDGTGCKLAEAGWFFEDDRASLLIAKNAHPSHWMPFPPPPKE